MKTIPALDFSFIGFAPRYQVELVYKNSQSRDIPEHCRGIPGFTSEDLTPNADGVVSWKPVDYEYGACFGAWEWTVVDLLNNSRQSCGEFFFEPNSQSIIITPDPVDPDTPTPPP